MTRLPVILIAVLAAVAGLASPASAQLAKGVVKEGRIYHAPVCPDVSPGFARCHARVVSDANGTPIVRDASPAALPAGYGPADLRSAYKVTAQGNSATVIAIVDAYAYAHAEEDLAVYRSTYGLPSCTSANGCFAKYNQRGQKANYPRRFIGWAEETALDLDMASAMCPYCKIILVQADSASNVDLAAAVNQAAALGAHVISNSYGGGEQGSESDDPAYTHPGVAITASTGDDGYGVSYPASSPHVIAVGGTALVRDGSARGWKETAWNGAGSGCSKVWAKPAWQTDPSCATRIVADVSAVADPSTGVAVYGPTRPRQSGWSVFGGTSVSAPLIGGIYGANGGSVHYARDLYQHRGNLFDITSGSNGKCGGSYFCTAMKGYDGPTGLGTPNGIVAF